MGPFITVLELIAGRPLVSFATLVLGFDVALSGLTEQIWSSVAAIALAAVAHAIFMRLSQRSVRADGPATEAAQQASMIAHELRTKLGIITLQLDAIADPRALIARHEIQDLRGRVDRLSEALSSQRRQ